MSAQSMLLGLAEGAELFLSPREEPYATVVVDGHHVTLRINTAQLGQLLSSRYYAATGEVASKRALREVIEALAAKAHFEGGRQPLYLRVGEHEGRVYLDLANDQGQTVEIGPQGWRVVDHAGVKFRRARGMQALPVPQRGGSVDELRPLLNLGTEDDWQLLIGYLLCALRPNGPYPLLLLHGEQGSAKSTFARMVVALLDPNCAALRAEPGSVRDLMVAADNTWMLSFDNLSGMPDWLSDALCRLATGGAFGKRQLFSDGEQFVMEAQRPVILTGIGELASRGDLLDRSLLFELPPLPKSSRRPETELWHEFEAIRARVLGALFDAVAGGLERLPATTLSYLPRMADAALWVSAAEPTLQWRSGTFLAAYERNQANANENALDACPITAPLFSLLARGRWDGPARNLLRVLSGEAGDAATIAQGWPKNPRVLADTLRRLSPNLRAAGVAVQFWRAPDRRRTRMISLENSASSASSASSPDVASTNQMPPPVAPDAPRSPSGPSSPANETPQSVLAAREGDSLLDEAAAELRTIVRQARESGDLKTSVAAARELIRVAAQKSQFRRQARTDCRSYALNTGPNYQFHEVSDDELNEFIRQHAAALESPRDSQRVDGGDERSDLPAGAE